MKRSDELLNKQIGGRIRTTRILRGLTQQKLGFSVGITFQQVQKYEQGKNGLSATRLIEVARALEVSVNYLLDVQDRYSHSKWWIKVR
jgi:transcriptional regulator with XRE-family HTH domain